MSEIRNYINNLIEKSEKRFNDFDIKEIEDIDVILDSTYLESPVWVGGDKEFVCLFIDLDKSSKQSFKKHPKSMARIYDYFTQNIVDVLNHPKIGADYIDIKGDGAFGIFSGEQASFKAMYCAITFKTLFEEKIRSKFSTESDKLSCKFGIHKDKILVKRIGKRGEGNYNEVWAGRLVNNAAKLADQTKKIKDNLLVPFLPIIVSEKIYSDFEYNKEFGFYSCCDYRTEQSMADKQVPIFEEHSDFSDEILGNKFYSTRVLWCKNCADNYMGLIK